MKRTPVDPATRRPADHHGHRRTPKIVRFRHEVGYLVEAARDEINELHFRHRPQPQKSHSASSAHNRCLADRRLNHALAAKSREQPFGGFERSAIHADVLADRHYGWIAVHFFEHGLADSLDHRYGGHVSVFLACRVDFDVCREDFEFLALTCPWALVQTEHAEYQMFQAPQAAAVAFGEPCRPISPLA